MQIPALRLFVPALFITLLASCASNTDSSETNPYAALFQSSSTAVRTPNSVIGLWGGFAGEGDLDVRFRIEADRVTAANRCRYDDGTTLTVGATARATVTATAIVTLESDDGVATSGSSRCSVALRVAETPYVLDETQLTLGEGREVLVLVKISD